MEKSHKNQNDNKDLLYWDITSMLFRDDWTALVSREKATKLRNSLKERIHPEIKIILLDFLMVHYIDISFCDSFLIPLLDDYGGKKIIIGVNGNNYLFKHHEDDTELNAIDEFLHEKGKEFLTIDKDIIPYIVGVNNKLTNLVFNLLWKYKSLTKQEIYRKLDIDNEDINSAIDYLLDKSYVKEKVTRKQKYHFIEVRLFDRISGYLGKTAERMIKKEYDEIIDKAHFELPSKVHVTKLYRVSRLIANPRLIRYIGNQLADYVRNDCDFVLSVETPNNIILSHRIAQMLGGNTRAIFARLSENENEFILHKGFEIKEDESGLIVIDVVVTGLITRLLIDLVENNNATLLYICSIFNLSKGKVTFHPYSFYSIIEESEKFYKKKNCPLCKEKIPLFKPKIMPGDWK